MKKIFLFFFVLLLVFCFSVHVLAAEFYSYSIPAWPSDPPSDLSFLSVDSIPSVGNYRFEFNLTFYGIDLFYSGICSAFDNGYYIYIPFVLNDGNFSWNFSLWFVYDPLYLAELGVSSPIILPINNDSGDVNINVFGSHLTLEKIESVGFTESINSGLSSVLSWIHSFSLSFFTGQLSPLLTVFILGICIAALFLSIRFIYKSCWGC